MWSGMDGACLCSTLATQRVWSQELESLLLAMGRS